MDNRIKIIWVIAVAFCIFLIGNSCLYKRLPIDRYEAGLAKSVESFPDHSRIPDHNLK